MNLKIFSVEIHKAHFEQVELLKEICKSDIVSVFPTGHTEFLDGNASTSVFSWKNIKDAEKLHQHTVFAELGKFIETQAKIYWDNLGYQSGVTPKIYQSWINVYEKTGRSTSHNHGRAPMTAAMYLSASPEQGNIVFESPLELVSALLPYEDCYSVIRHEIPVNTGDLIIFPGYIKHCTLPNLTDKKRIIFGANLNETGVYNSKYFPEY